MATFHVGIYPSIDRAFIFNTSTKNVSEIPIQWFLNKPSVWDPLLNPFKRIYDTIKSNINGLRGCVSIVLEKYDNITRKDFIQQRYEAGFEKVEIIDAQTARYLHATFYSDYVPKNGDIIWIIHNGICHVWKKTNNKAKYIRSMTAEYSTLQKYLTGESEDGEKNEKSNSPNAILYDNDNAGLREFNLPCYKFETFPISNFSFARLFKSENNSFLTAKRGPLIHARLIADDPDLIEYSVERMLDRELTVKINQAGNSNTSDNIIVQFKNAEQLPFQCKIYLKKLMENNKMIIESEQPFPRQPYLLQPAIIDRENLKHVYLKQKVEEKVPLPPRDNLIVTMNIDRNGIHTVNIEEMSLQSFSNIDEFINAFYGTLNSESSEQIPTPISTSEIQRYSIPKQIFTNNSNINAVGIDLGTTRCCAAVNRNNGIQTAVLDNTGQRLLPSYVGYDEKHDKCGKIVIDRLRNYANSSVFDMKRIIGKSFDAIKSDESWTFEVENNANEAIIVTHDYKKETLKKSPEEISAVLLKHIKDKTEEFQGHKLTEAVITVPAAFDNAQKAATETSAKLAGWQKIHLLPEPVAATFAYFIDRPIPEECTVLLFDLGGGTLDVCIFKILKGELNIICRCGDPNLGGRDFDNILIEYFKEHLKSNYGIDLSQSRQYKLMQKCQEAKETLTVTNEYMLDVEDFGNVEDDSFIRITRQQFENMSEELLENLKKCITSALEKAECTKRDMNKVLYVGGGCRMPKVKELLKEIFPHAEHCCEENPDEVVAVGAAYYAYYLNFDTTSNYENTKLVHYGVSSVDKQNYTFPNKVDFYDRSVNAIGIGVGVGNCSAAVNRKNGIETFGLDSLGQRLLSSYVAFDEDKPKCGQFVIDRLRNFSKSTIYDMQILLGKTLEEIHIDSDWPFVLTTSSNRLKIKVKNYGNESSKYPEEVLAVLLKHIKQRAEEFQGKLINEAVLTIPTWFNEKAQNATRAAALLAEFKQIHLLPEPVAAVFGYFVDRPVPTISTIFLFDLGDKVLDISIITIEQNQVNIKSSHKANIGGRDFDNLLYKYFKETLVKRFHINITENRKFKLMRECHEIKENLSTLDEDSLDVDDYDPSCDFYTNIQITRKEFEEMSAELLNRLREIIENHLAENVYRPNQIDKVLLVGGGCRMPMVKNLLQEMFLDSEQFCDQNPDEVIAIGATHYAYYLKTASQDKSRCCIT